MQFVRISLLAFLLAAVAGCNAAPPAPAASLATATGSAKVSTASGLVFESLVAGSGASPKATDTVRVHYRGTFPDGREFDSSYRRGQPAEFPLNRVIPCWTEAVQLMKPGGKAKITCPPAIAYGARGAGGVIPPNATLNYEIELIGIK
jgi:FKBP-type peptidyl-prolyl cis-trans isomerase FkpA